MRNWLMHNTKCVKFRVTNRCINILRNLKELWSELLSHTFVQVVIKMLSSAPGGLHAPHEARSYLSLCPQWHTWGDPLLWSPRSPPASRICCQWSAAQGSRMSEMPRCCFDRLKSPYLQFLPGWPSSPLTLCLLNTRRIPAAAAAVTAASSLLFAAAVRAPEWSPDTQVKPW